MQVTIRRLLLLAMIVETPVPPKDAFGVARKKAFRNHDGHPTPVRNAPSPLCTGATSLGAPCKRVFRKLGLVYSLAPAHFSRIHQDRTLRHEKTTETCCRFEIHPPPNAFARRLGGYTPGNTWRYILREQFQL